MREAHVTQGDIGLVVWPMDRTRPDTRFNSRTQFNPASVMKTLTTLAALDTLGPAHAFQTHVLIEGTLSDGILKGNLILQGGGDPALNLEHFQTLLHEIRMHGLREIDGDVIVDDGFYGIEQTDPGSFDGEPLKPYNATPDALLVNYNALPLRLAPGLQGVTAFLDPPALPVDDALIADDKASCGDWQDSLTVEHDGGRLKVSGRYPLACGARVLWLSLMAPTDTVAALFKAKWSASGGTLTGRVRVGQTPAGAEPLLDFDSPQLSEIVRLTNKYSNNVMAKMLFLDLGAIRFGAPATWDKGQRAVRDWLTGNALDMPGLVIENGSGLSRAARISAESVARLLIWASERPLYYEFAASLPALGLEGTQRRRMKGQPQAGRAWLKSGSLDGVHNLAGYVLDSRGRRKVLVLFIQGVTAGQAKHVQDAVLRWVIGAPLITSVHIQVKGKN